MTGATHEDRAVIAFEASVRATASQEAQLSAIHTRASFVLGTAGIATGTVLGRGTISIHGFGLLAVVAFALAAVLATCVIAPRTDVWRFAMNAATILDVTAERPQATKAEILEWLARKGRENYARNKSQLDDLYALLTLACGALALAIAATIVSFATT